MLSTEPFEVPKYLETLASKLPGLAVAIAGADHPIALESARRVAETGTIEPVLIGDADTIHNLAKDAGWDLSDIRILHEPDEEKKAGIAAALAKGREVAIIMKGHVHTDALMRAVLRRDAGLDDDPSLINDLYRACADVGFFYVRNHGVSMELVESVKRAAEDFFTAPMAEKMKVVLDQRIRGFYAHNRVTSVGHLIEGEDRSGLNCKEGFWAGHERPLCDSALLHGPNQWPEDHPELKQSMLTFFDAAEGLAEVLLWGGCTFART